MTEHETKYEALAQELGVDVLRAILPTTAERIRQALDGGDEHLNTIPLAAWDRAASAWTAVPKQDVWRYGRAEKCPCCENGTRQVLPPANPVWSKRRLSLAERVCVLKHVAKFHSVPA